ncbi:hypothetical protein ANCCAN_06123 [Ancylostoma caninum]|uniref:Uncharacterized protein n=1 Tax=Ancylostoma caninum TaxID=29170 RepID=A0A368GTS9_ANCCA|nr:hypothetical protein ANCCAN_06123 [Ancylostoma caninum]
MQLHDHSQMLLSGSLHRPWPTSPHFTHSP